MTPSNLRPQLHHETSESAGKNRRISNINQIQPAASTGNAMAVGFGFGAPAVAMAVGFGAVAMAAWEAPTLAVGYGTGGAMDQQHRT